MQFYYLFSAFSTETSKKFGKKRKKIKKIEVKGLLKTQIYHNQPKSYLRL